MRKFLIIILTVICLIVILNNKDEKEIRIRIIPNSDLKKDLDIKEKAKDITICYLKNAYDKNYDIFIDNIKKTKDDFANLLENNLNEKIKLDLGNHTLYNKTYNNTAVKNTNQMVLYIVIGSGDGSNWWGTVYPEFLEVSSSEEMKYESLIVHIFEKLKGEKSDDD